ncbi:CBO0543 family protein [Cohnella panacarvi]|uniref:CBO0543 family protein n=1 Tax=Cohnella panacarvi TaxID=400776 RepID=UPI00047898F7|nr:CBO0543 family protein [Cohnella panacarvi]
MTLERGILIGVTIVSLLLILVIPRQHYRLAMVAFLTTQFMTTILGHVVVDSGALAYPVREFAEINRTSFIYEFLAYPMICALFNVYYPANPNRLLQIGYFVLYSSVLTIIEVVIERYTKLIDYIQWNWFWTWGSLLIVFTVTRLVCVVFFSTIRQAND